MSPAPRLGRWRRAAATIWARAWSSLGPRHGDGAELSFVWIVWLLQSYLLLDFVTRESTNVPYYDEWEMIPVLLGKEPLTLKWLWSLHNEHRVFLGRLVYVLVERVGNYDFRAGMIFNCLALMAAAALLMYGGRRVRGRASFFDAFFPLLLLSWGQAENLLWSFQIQFVLGGLVSAVVLFTLLRPGVPSTGSAVTLAFGAILFALLGGNGIALVPTTAACALLASLELFRQRAAGRRWPPLAVALLASTSLALLAFYFVDYERPAKHPPASGVGAALGGTLEFFSLALGSGVRAYRPVGAYMTAGFAVVTALLLAWRCWVGNARLWALRLGLFLVGLCALAAGIGWARIAFYSAGAFPSRYSTLAAPLLCGIYFAWELAKPPARGLAQAGLFLLAALLVQRNRDDGYGEALGLQRGHRAAWTAARSGMTPAEFATQHCGYLYYVCTQGVFAKRVTMLRDARVGAFKRMK